MKWRVPIHGAPNKTIRVDDNATEGAVVGVNLRWPDGTVVRVEDILNGDAKTSPSGQPVAPQVPGQGASPPPSQGFAPQLWNLLQGVPPNVRQVELLATSGLVTRKADGTWVTREILTATLDVINADGDAGDVTINLAELTDTGTGALLAIDRDVYGRVEGSRPADFDDIVTALGFTPEDVENKATSLASPDNTTYPTTLAVSNAISSIVVAQTFNRIDEVGDIRIDEDYNLRVTEE